MKTCGWGKQGLFSCKNLFASTNPVNCQSKMAVNVYGVNSTGFSLLLETLPDIKHWSWLFSFVEDITRYKALVLVFLFCWRHCQTQSSGLGLSPLLETLPDIRYWSWLFSFVGDIARHKALVLVFLLCWRHYQI